MSRAQKAKELFLKGYACSQAIVLAFSDVTGLDCATIEKLSLPFGGGMGRLRLTCGAVSGAALVIGSVFSDTGVNPENKKRVYAIVQEVSKKIKEENGSLICGELLSNMKLPVETGGVAEQRSAEYYKKRSCGDIVAKVAQILEDYLKENGKL